MVVSAWPSATAHVCRLGETRGGENFRRSVRGGSAVAPALPVPLSGLALSGARGGGDRPPVASMTLRSQCVYLRLSRDEEKNAAALPRPTPDTRQILHTRSRSERLVGARHRWLMRDGKTKDLSRNAPILQRSALG